MFPNYSPKDLSNEIQDLSFSEELSTLNRVSSVSSLNQYYSKSVNQPTNIYNSDFNDDFSNDHFTNSLPPTSTIFHQNEANSTFVLSENQSDELLLNNIELSDNDRVSIII